MQALSESELSIMLKIWQEDRPLYFREILDLLKEYNWVESTVRNFLARIIDKGYLKVEKQGRKNIYTPLVSQDYVNKEGKKLLERLYDNSIKKFIVELYESDSINQGDLMELRKYIDRKMEGED